MSQCKIHPFGSFGKPGRFNRELSGCIFCQDEDPEFYTKCVEAESAHKANPEYVQRPRRRMKNPV